MDYLDISILHLDKYLTSEKRKEEFIYSNMEIEEKFDGVKVSIIKMDNNFIVSYKGNIIYSTEFEYASSFNIRNQSINNSQFKLIFEKLEKVDINKIPENVEFFIEFLMNKPTLSANYTKKGIVLLSYSKCNPIIKFGKIKTNSTQFNTKDRDKFAKIFGFYSPELLFKGQLSNFERSIIDKNLKSEFQKYKNNLNINNIDDYISKITEMFLNLPSKFGNKPEGFIFKFNDRLLKINQPYQTDQSKRAEIKNKFKGNEQEESNYWKLVRLSALNIIQRLKTPNENNLQDVLKDAALELSKYKIDFTHPKKTLFQIQDDIQRNIKMVLIKNMKGNNNFLFLGKFRILTNAHYKIIKNGLKKYDDGVIVLVSNNDTLKLKDLRLKMLKSCFPNIEIIEARNGNILSILNKCDKNINVVLAGTDRANEYRNLLSRNPDLYVEEIGRDSNDISASAVLENIDNFLFFKRNTPKEIHHLYDEIIKNKELFLNTKS